MNVKACDLMTSAPITIGLGHSVYHAAKIMQEKQVSGLPVLDDEDKIVGILTEGDLLRHTELCKTASHPSGVDEKPLAKSDAQSFVKRMSWKVADCMSGRVITVQEDESVAQIASLMLENGIKRLPVLRHDKLVGIVSRADLLKCVINGTSDNLASGDVALCCSVRARLRYDIGLGAEIVQTSVVNGTVVLVGEVPSAELSHAATVVAESIKGIRDVINNLTVPTRGV